MHRHQLTGSTERLLKQLNAPSLVGALGHHDGKDCLQHHQNLYTAARDGRKQEVTMSNSAQAFLGPQVRLASNQLDNTGTATQQQALTTLTLGSKPLSHAVDKIIARLASCSNSNCDMICGSLGPALQQQHLAWQSQPLEQLLLGKDENLSGTWRAITQLTAPLTLGVVCHPVQQLHQAQSIARQVRSCVKPPQSIHLGRLCCSVVRNRKLPPERAQACGSCCALHIL